MDDITFLYEIKARTLQKHGIQAITNTTYNSAASYKIVYGLKGNSTLILQCLQSVC